MILKSLEDLDRYKKIMTASKNIVSLKDINEVSEGGESTNSYNNKLFYWNFAPYYIEQLVNCYEEVAKGEANKIFIPFEATGALSSLGAAKEMFTDKK